jgi:hypothetical protein
MHAVLYTFYNNIAEFLDNEDNFKFPSQFPFGFMHAHFPISDREFIAISALEKKGENYVKVF